MLFLFLSTAFFVCIAFITNHSQEKIINPLFTYYFYEARFLLDHLLLFLTLFFFATLFFPVAKHHKHLPFSKRYKHSLVNACSVFLFGFVASALVLLTIAFVQLNILAFIINTNPKLLGVESDMKTLLNDLDASNHSPQILASDVDQEKILLAVATAITGKENFYGNYILPAVPDILVIPFRQQNSSVLLVDNTLIVTRVEPKDFGLISPVVGFLLVKQYFTNRYIKSYPAVVVMDHDNYTKLRRVDAQEKLVKIDSILTTIEENMSSISAVLTQSQQGAPLESQSQLEDQLNKDKYFDEFYKTQRKILQGALVNIPHELGVFSPPDGIGLVIDSTSSHAVADYFETLTHEYLHYASYHQDKHLDSQFFEEGLTEYFARQIIKDEVNTDTNLGYPVQEKIINQIAKLISDGELADIYFNKDNQGLADALDRVYGDNFYENNKVLFESLQYASNKDQILQLANEIMQKIGGTPLTFKDQLSSHSKL